MKYFFLTSALIGIMCISSSFKEKQVVSCNYSNMIFDYFRHQNDSNIYIIGSVFLMPSDSLSFVEKNEYCTKETIFNGSVTEKKIFFKDELLYSYTVKDDKINGVGYIYYPFLKKIAIQGNFCNSKLQGLVTVQNKNGKIMEIMKYRNGKYIKHVFHQKYGYNNYKLDSKNPLNNDYLLVD